MEIVDDTITLMEHTPSKSTSKSRDIRDEKICDTSSRSESKENSRGITSEDSIGEDQDTYETIFEKLSELCDTKDINPLDVLGIAMPDSNEMVKHVKTFNEG